MRTESTTPQALRVLLIGGDSIWGRAIVETLGRYAPVTLTVTTRGGTLTPWPDVQVGSVHRLDLLHDPLQHATETMRVIREVEEPFHVVILAAAILYGTETEVRLVNAAHPKAVLQAVLQGSPQAHVVICSSVAAVVAGERLAAYGRSKQELEQYARRLVPKGNLRILRAGQIETPMSAHAPRRGPRISAERAAAGAARAMRLPGVVHYVPWYLGVVVTLLRILPRRARARL